MDFIRDFSTSPLFAISATQIGANLAVALLCGSLISFFYRWSNRNIGFSTSFVHALITLAMVTALVIMVIENNLARAFGLVGAMSIIRFRTAVKDIGDIVFIFFSLAVGMAAGVGLAKMALLGSLFIGAVALLLSHSGSIGRAKTEYLLQFTFAATGNADVPYLALFGQFCRSHNLVNMKNQGEQGPLELAYYIRFKKREQQSEFVRQLGQLAGVSDISLFYDEGHN